MSKEKNEGNVKLLNKKEIGQIWEVKLSGKIYFGYGTGNMFFVTEYNPRNESEIQITPEQKEYNQVYSLVSEEINKMFRSGTKFI